MYRLFLNPTDESPQRELWLDAEDVHESEGGACWEFVDREGHVLRRLEKSRVKAFDVTSDRRKPRPGQSTAVQDELWGVGFAKSRRPQDPS